MRSRRSIFGPILVVLLGAAGLLAVDSFAGDAAGAAGCGPAPSGQVAVVVVVDRGTGTPSARCVHVAERSTGLDALVAAGHTPRMNGGFVCGIDGLPATGCGTPNGAGFDYWRYWHATPSGSWSYSNVGAGGYRLPSRCTVEGWSWSVGGADPPVNEPPRLAVPPVTCETPVTTPPAATNPPAATSPSPTPAPGAPPTVATPQAPGAAPGVAPPDGSGTPSGDGDPATSSTVAPDAASVPGADGETPSVGEDVAEPEDGDEASVQNEVAGRSVERASATSADGRAGDSGSAGSAVGVVVALCLVAVLAGVAFVRSRRRQVPEGP